MSIRDCARCTRGTVMVETGIAFMPLFMRFLGIVQYVLLAAAQLVVQHAAVCGARAASVALDDDPARYGGAERLSIADDGDDGSSGALLAIASTVLGAVPATPAVPPGLAAQASRGYGPRMRVIRDAVYLKLAAIVPSRALAALLDAPGVSVLDALGEQPALRLIQAPLYLPVTTAITFPRGPGSRELYEDHVDPEELITVRVTHLVTCSVPLVGALMCKALAKAASLQTASDPTAELQRAPAAGYQAQLKRSGAATAILQAEATLPLQRAPYKYASEP